MGCVCVGWGLLKKHRRNWQQNNNNDVNSVEACCDFLGLFEEDIPRGHSGKCIIMTLLLLWRFALFYHYFFEKFLIKKKKTFSMIEFPFLFFFNYFPLVMIGFIMIEF